MTIITRAQVRAAVDRALQLDPDMFLAILAAAASLGLPVEAVRDALEPAEETAS
jgi:hypothetical protein